MVINKKYLIIIVSVFAVLVLVFSLWFFGKLNLTALSPSFELYSAGGCFENNGAGPNSCTCGSAADCACPTNKNCTSYPTIKNVDATPVGNQIQVTATIYDVSGIFIAPTAYVRDISGDVVGSVFLSSKTAGTNCIPSDPCTFEGISTVNGGLTSGNYTIDIVATDRLGLNSNICDSSINPALAGLDCDGAPEHGTCPCYFNMTGSSVSSDDSAELINLEVSLGALDPVFSRLVTNYSAEINIVGDVSIKPTASTGSATITVIFDGVTNSVTSGNWSAPMALIAGINDPIEIIVTSGDGTVTKTYTITYIYALSDDATLSSITPSSGSLSTTFNSNVFSYQVVLPYGTPLTPVPTVSAVKSDPLAGVTQYDQPDNLNGTLEERTATITQVAEDGVATENYTVEFSIARNPEAQINSFSLGVLDESVSIQGYNIDVTVPSGTSITNLTPTITYSTGATLTPSASTPRNFTSPVTYSVTSEDGVTTHVYNVTVSEMGYIFWDSPAYPEYVWSGIQDPYNNDYHDSRAEFIIDGGELYNAGLRFGSRIDAIYLKSAEVPIRNLANFMIRVKLTGGRETVTGWEGGWTTVFGPTEIDKSDPGLASGKWKKYIFTNTFRWNGWSSIMFDISRDDTTFVGGGAMYYRANVGTNRMFAGFSDSYKDSNLDPTLDAYLVDRVQGSASGSTFNNCPSLAMNHSPVSGNIPTSITLTGPTSAAIGSSITLTATLTGPGPLANQTISFEDLTLGAGLGLVTTDASGVATFNYTISEESSIGSHAFYAGFDGQVVGTIYDPAEIVKNIDITAGPTSLVELWKTGYNLTMWNSGDYYSDPYNTWDKNSRAEFIVTKADIEAAGITGPKNIRAIYLKTAEKAGRDLANFRIRVKSIGTRTTVTGWEDGWTTVFGPQNLNVVTNPTDVDLTTPGNWKKYLFTSDFVWNGTDNLMFDISRNDYTYTSGGHMYIRESIGTYRMFSAGTDNEGPPELSDITSGSLYGGAKSSCPAVKLLIVN